MTILYFALAGVALVAGLVCSIIVLIEAFRDEIWKGVLCLVCGLYFLYYCFFEFEHDEKLLVALIAIGGNAIAAGFYRLATGG